MFFFNWQIHRTNCSHPKILWPVVILASFFFINSPNISISQSIAIELHTGLLNYQGDLRQETFTLKDGRFAFGIGVTADLTNRIAFRFLYLTGTLHADDKMNSQPQYYYRNLNFTSNVSEQGIQVQLQLFKGDKYRLNPFIVTGIGSFKFNPFTFDVAGDKFYLQPLNTEGQGFITGAPPPYRLREWCFPAGGGVRFRLSNSISVSWEVTLRYTLTDYLDDVSTFYPQPNVIRNARGPQAAELSFRALELPGPNPMFPNGFSPTIRRGNPTNGDWYYFSGVKIRYNLFATSSRERVNNRKMRNRGRVDCPY